MITNSTPTMAAAGQLLGLGILLVPTVDAHLANGSIGSHDVGNSPGCLSPPIIHYGAIAYAPSGASGAWHQRTPARAERRTCRQDLQSARRFTRCGAVAYNGSKYC